MKVISYIHLVPKHFALFTPLQEVPISKPSHPIHQIPISRHMDSTYLTRQQSPKIPRIQIRRTIRNIIPKV